MQGLSVLIPFGESSVVMHEVFFKIVPFSSYILRSL